MGGKRRPRRRSGGAAGGDVPQPSRLAAVRSWRRRIDAFGGFLTVGAVVGAIAVVAFIVVRNPPAAISDDALLGEPVTLGQSSHITDASLMQITPGEPPAGGPHFAEPAQPGVYEGPIADGNAVHALEHGLVWISYRADLVDDATVSALEAIAGDFGRDLIVSPRPDNAMPIAAVSWGRILRLDEFDEEQLRAFVTTNRNRSPEPGVR